MNRKNIRIIIAVIMCLAMVFPLASCGGGSGEVSESSAPADQGSAAEEEQTAPAEKIIWNVGTIGTDPAVNSELNSTGAWLAVLQEKLDEYTNGQIQLVVHWKGILGGQPQLFEQCEMGELEVFQGQPMSSNDQRFACWNIPYCFDTLEQIDKALANGEGEIYKMAESWIEEHNMHLLAMGAGFIRGYANNKHEVIAPQDVKGIKTRVYEDALVRSFWDGLTQTQILPVSDIYSGLQTGTVDGLEMMATQLMVDKYYEEIKYFTDINWQWVNSQMFIVSDKAWSALTPEQQEAVQKATTEAMPVQTQKQIEFDKNAYKQLEELGVKVTMLTPEQRQVWIDYAESLTDKYKEIIGADVYEEYMAAVARARGL